MASFKDTFGLRTGNPLAGSSNADPPRLASAQEPARQAPMILELEKERDEKRKLEDRLKKQDALIEKMGAHIESLQDEVERLKYSRQDSSNALLSIKIKAEQVKSRRSERDRADQVQLETATKAIRDQLVSYCRSHQEKGAQNEADLLEFSAEASRLLPEVLRRSRQPRGSADLPQLPPSSEGSFDDESMDPISRGWPGPYSASSQSLFRSKALSRTPTAPKDNATSSPGTEGTVPEAKLSASASLPVQYGSASRTTETRSDTASNLDFAKAVRQKLAEGISDWDLTTEELLAAPTIPRAERRAIYKRKLREEEEARPAKKKDQKAYSEIDKMVFKPKANLEVAPSSTQATQSGINTSAEQDPAVGQVSSAEQPPPEPVKAVALAPGETVAPKADDLNAQTKVKSGWLVPAWWED